jgi:hypothetical protein
VGISALEINRWLNEFYKRILTPAEYCFYAELIDLPAE